MVRADMGHITTTTPTTDLAPIELFTKYVIFSKYSILMPLLTVRGEDAASLPHPKDDGHSCEKHTQDYVFYKMCILTPEGLL